MLDLSLAEVARLLGVRAPAAGAAPLRGVVCDSRAVRPGDLFVALAGARTDGHAHLPDAAGRGAAAALVQRGRPRPDAAPPCLEVDDPLEALAELARAQLLRLRPRVFGVTGTVGKTTAKDLLAQLLGGGAEDVHAAPASYNSEIGLPLSVLGAPPGTRALVLEYGVNAPGEMERLLRIARPQEAWITAISPVHLEGMGDLATIAREKCALAAAVPPHGRVWLGAALLERLSAYAATWSAPPSPCPGLAEPGLTVRARTPLAWRVEHPRWGELLLPLVAEHEVQMALAAAEIAAAQGVRSEQLRERLARLERPEGRLTVHRCAGFTVLDDSYNASPASLAAALRALREWPCAGRRIAVLGTMHELGAEAEPLHRAAGREAAALGLDLLVGVGLGGAWLADAAASAGARVRRCAGVGEAAALAAELRAGDVLLLKASRAERLDRLREELSRVDARGAAGAERAAGGR